ncbi:MAG: type II toxin-antitoxin system RelE/ParE family toxin [Gallionellaceae bacterium]|nr:type II toxin-antitoxin system RelE/ParE family toxin [Gallionellaceae bacterium]
MTYYFHPAASEEYLDSVAFYESRLAGLGADYIAEFEATLKRICVAPLSYPLDCQPNIRKAGFQRFPFSVLYRVAGDAVQVLAVAHHRRSPRYWLERTKK